MNNTDLAQIKARHISEACRAPNCGYCGQRWPCDADQLAKEITRLHQVLWTIAATCGMDTDGATGPEAITHPGIDEIALKEVYVLRLAYEDECSAYCVVER